MKIIDISNDVVLNSTISGTFINLENKTDIHIAKDIIILQKRFK